VSSAADKGVLGTSQALETNLWAPEKTLDDLNDEDRENGYNTGDDDESDDEDESSRPWIERKPNARCLGPGQHWASARMTRILHRMSLERCQKGTTISS